MYVSYQAQLALLIGKGDCVAGVRLEQTFTPTSHDNLPAVR